MAMTKTPKRPSLSARATLLTARATLLALCALLAWPARANPFELFGFTPRGIGMGGAMVGLADDVAGSFYNPAGIVGHTKAEFGIGFADTIPALHINRAKTSAGTPISGEVDSAPRFEIGIIFPLGGLLKDRVVIGIGGGHPFGSLVRVQTVDQAHPQFYMYQSKAQRFALDAGIGIKIVDGLSIGAGASVIAQQIGKVRFAVDVASRRFVARDITVDLNTVATPMVGILVEPTETLKFGLSWRKEQQLYYEQPTDINLGDIGDLALDVQGIAQFWPHVFSGGVSYKPAALSGRLLISAQLDFLVWSRAPRDQVSVTIRPSGPVLDGLGLSDILGFRSQDVTPGFANILVPRLGVEFVATDVLTLRVGASARPPVTPDQRGTTNYLDNFTETFSGGATFKFIDPLKVFTDPVALDVGFSATIANEREMTKFQTNDATGGATYGGALFTASAMLRYLY
jgi:long-subunit fatty acid transport protein